jgi:magnesium chelatase family protein
MVDQLAHIHARALVGIEAHTVSIEVHIQSGMPHFALVGLPETAVKQTRHRVQSAIVNSGFTFPQRKIVVSLAPADLPKRGASFDLAIAIAILAASGQVAKQACAAWVFLGELALSGAIRAVPGSLAVSYASAQADQNLMLPKENIEEATLVRSARIIGCSSLHDAVTHLCSQQPHTFAKPLKPTIYTRHTDIAQVTGQDVAKRALTIAAAGGHNLLMCGPPGCGKSMLAACLPGLLPPMTDKEAMEVAMIYSISNQGFQAKHWGQRPFRSPHHSASMPALVGGGNPPKPGEISLAHECVIFLDELPEYPRSVLEALREPLETGAVMISRAQWQCPFPAHTQLIAAMNPCPCGYDGCDDGRCRCTIDQIQRYQAKISGPLLDRIDLHVRVTPIDSATLLRSEQIKTKQNQPIAEQIKTTWAAQQARQGCRNSALSAQQTKQYCILNDQDRQWLAEALKKLQLSARSIHRTLKVARTIADLDHLNTDNGLPRKCLLEALSYARRSATAG